MTVLNVQKVNTLPGVLTSNTLYLMKNSDPGLLDIYLTNSDGTDVRHILTKADISSLISTNITDYAFNNLVSFVNDINGKLDHLVAKNDIIDIKPKPILLGDHPYPWDVDVGTKIFINPNCLTGFGKNKCVLEFWSDGEVWVPYQEQILYSSYGSYASPVASIVQPATPSETIFFGSESWHRIPRLLMYNGLGVRVKARCFKNDSDAGTTTFRLRFGQTSSGASGDIIASATAATTSHQIAFDVVARINILGVLTVAQFTTPGIQKLVTSATISADAGADRKVGFSTNVDNFVTLSTSAGNGNSGAAIADFSISLVP